MPSKPIRQSPRKIPSPEDNSLTVLGKHHVAAGETLECIGRGYGVLPEAIAGFNHIDPNAELQIGQVLEIPAIRWTDIPAGPVCPPQFEVAFWDASSLIEESQPTTTMTATQLLQVFVEPTRTLRVFTKPPDPPNPAIQVPPPGNPLPPIPCCDTCLTVCTATPGLIIITEPPPPPPPPQPTATLIPITLIPIDPFPCFPPPCPPTFSLP